jgi:hypothetical protein
MGRTTMNEGSKNFASDYTLVPAIRTDCITGNESETQIRCRFCFDAYGKVIMDLTADGVSECNLYCIDGLHSDYMKKDRFVLSKALPMFRDGLVVTDMAPARELLDQWRAERSSPPGEPIKLKHENPSGNDTVHCDPNVLADRVARDAERSPREFDITRDAKYYDHMHCQPDKPEGELR